MRPLTDHTPKPLLKVAGKPLIVHHLERLHAAGIHNIVINLGHLGEQIKTYLGDGSDYGVAIQYSVEPATALETGGGILQALPLLGAAPFIVINADIWTDYDIQPLTHMSLPNLAHLVMVDNPPQHPDGDFVLCSNGQLNNAGQPGTRLTFSGIRVMSPELLSGCKPGRFSLVPALRQAADDGLLTGEHHIGQWHDIGTPERLNTLNASLGYPS